MDSGIGREQHAAYDHLVSYNIFRPDSKRNFGVIIWTCRCLADTKGQQQYCNQVVRALG